MIRKRPQIHGNEYGMLKNGKVIVRKCPIEDKHKVMNTECKKMYGNDKEMPNLPKQNPAFEPRLPGPLGRPLVKVNLSK